MTRVNHTGAVTADPDQNERLWAQADQCHHTPTHMIRPDIGRDFVSMSVILEKTVFPDQHTGL
jgi:hypothetical protein